MAETFRVLLPDAVNEIHSKYSSCNFFEAKTNLILIERQLGSLYLYYCYINECGHR